MEKRSLVTIIIASVLIASGVSAIFSPRISPYLTSLFSTQIPGVSVDLIHAKAFDLAEFGTTFIFSVLFSVLNIFLFRRITGNFKIPNVYLLVCGLVIFLLTRFATYSGKAVLEVVALMELIFAGAALFSKKLPKPTKIDSQELTLALFSGVFLGFYALLVLNRLTPVVIFPLMALIVLPIVNYWLNTHIKNWAHIMSFFPGVLVPILLFFPTNLTPLLIWAVAAILIWGLSYRFHKSPLPKHILIGFVYPGIIVALIGYNPLFYIGNFDSVEEGFWSGWVQRLWQHQALYKDASAWQPPLIVWGLYLFERIAGFTLYAQRLFMHLLQIAGYVIYFLFLKKFIKKSWVIAVIMVCFFGLTSTAVKNNVEIRIGLGLAAVISLTSDYLPASGALTALALFTSTEVGIASIVTSFVYMLVSRQNKIKNISKWVLGLAFGGAPIILIMWMQGSLSAFIQQMLFYASAFSHGYFNTPIDRAISLSYFHWHIFNQFIGSTAMWFEVSKIVIFVALIYGFFLDKKVLAISVFAAVLFRAALGRSDYFHLLFPLLVSLGLIGLAIDRLAKTKIATAVVLTTALLFLGVRDVVNSQFLENLVFRLQTYGTVVGEYKKYNFDRGAGILIGPEIDTSQTDDLIAYIQQNSTQQDYIFTYPWAPELYFLANRKNATSVDTPYAFFTPADQAKMINDLSINNPKMIIYNDDMNFGGLSVGALPEVDKYLKAHYKIVKEFGKNSVMQ